MAAKLVKVFEVMIDGKGAGAAGDGTHIMRFPGTKKGEADANALAAESTCYGSPAKVSTTDAPRHLAQRWGVA